MPAIKTTIALLCLFLLSATALDKCPLKSPTNSDQPQSDQTQSKTFCDPNNRPQFCTDDWTPVCAHITICATGEPCFQTASNACEGCALANADYHIPGECNPTSTPQKLYCNPDERSEVCPAVFRPVCAFKADCEGESCGRTAGNSCEACGHADVEYYIEGECPFTSSQEEEKTVCDPNNRPQFCTDDWTPVCAHITTCATGEPCFQTASNACEGCALANADYHIPGECSTASTPQKLYCNPDERSEVCPAVFRPVCAFKADCEGESCGQTAGNSCEACGHANIEYYIEGECPFTSSQEEEKTICDSNNRPQFCTDDWTPVCAHITICATGEPCFQTASNGCEGCALANADYHIPGECNPTSTPQKLYCNPDERSEVCPEVFRPVCAFKADCEGESCGRTAGNSCEACGQVDIEYYIEGECPFTSSQEEEKTVCDPNNRPQFCTDDWTPVCAHLTNCADGESCFQTASNACEGCALANADYHTPGECNPAPIQQQSTKIFCDPNERSEICPAVFMPVCAFKANCEGESCSRTAGNSCEACGDAGIEYYVSGECPSQPEETKTICDSNNRPEFCTDDWNPVCAYLSECADGDVCYQTASNACEGCAIANAEYHVPGECPP